MAFHVSAPVSALRVMYLPEAPYICPTVGRADIWGRGQILGPRAGCGGIYMKCHVIKYLYHDHFIRKTTINCQQFI